MDYIGNVYRVPDSWWGFEAVDRLEHPGACVSAGPKSSLNLLKGTSVRSQRYSRVVFEVEPDETNGLRNRTAFKLEPHNFRQRRIQLLEHDRLLGRLCDADLAGIQRELEELFAQGGDE